MRGFSSVEILVALTIIAFTISAVSLVAVSVPNIVADAKSAADALESARVSLHEMTKWDDLSGRLPSNVLGTSVTIGDLEDEAFSLMTILAPWHTARGDSRTTSLSSILRDSSIQNVCDPFTSNDWTHPLLVRSYQLRADLAPSIPAGTYSISSLTIAPGVLAVGIGSTTQPNTPSLFLFYLKGTTTPSLAAFFDNASTSRVGTSALSAAGPLIFAGNGFSSASPVTCADGQSCAQVLTYSIAPNSATMLSTLSLSTSSLPYAVTNTGATAPTTALTEYKGVLYLGLQKTAHGDELNIIDATDPAHLHWRSGYAIGRSVTNVTVRGTHAYVSTDDPSRELLVFDVSDPDHPAVISTWDAPGTSTFGFGSVSTAHNTSVRFGRTYTPNGPEFELLDLSDPEHVIQQQSVDSGTAKDPESVRALITQDKFTFMLLTHRLDVLDTHDPLHVQVVGSYALPDGSRGAALSCRNDTLYLGRNDADGSGVIDIIRGT